MLWSKHDVIETLNFDSNITDSSPPVSESG